MALVSAFAAAGWSVVAAGHSSLPDTPGPDVFPTRLDVTDADAVEALVAEVLHRRGRLDLLVNNAGVTRDGPLPRLDDDAWNRVLDVNLKGAFLCARAALGPMTRRGNGHILNIASFAGRSGARGQANYAAAKAGLIGLTLSLARETAASGIRVNAVLPGVLPTAMTRDLPAEVIAGFASANLLGRLNQPADVARAVVQFADLRDVSGQILQLDSRVSRWC